MKELSIIDIPSDKVLSVFTADNGTSPYLDKISEEVRSFVPDLTTKKGRDAIASIAHKVSKSKTALDNIGKELVTELKKQPKLVDAERKRMRDYLDDLKIEVRKPLTDWEEEQKRIAAEALAKQQAEELRKQIESDHEIGLLLHDKFIADKLRAEEQAERERVAHEDRIRQEAKEAAEAKAEQEKLHIEQEKNAAIAAQEKSERDRLAAEERAKYDAEQAEQRRIQAEERAKQDAIDAAALAKLEAERAQQKASQDAIDAAERARQQQISLQKQKEADALAEKERLESNRRHVGAIRKAAKLCIMEKGFTEEQAEQLVMCIHNGEIKHITISYAGVAK